MEVEQKQELYEMAKLFILELNLDNEIDCGEFTAHMITLVEENKKVV